MPEMDETIGERVYLKIYDYETKEFSGLTTFHGLVRIYNSNTWPSRIFWCVVVLSCLSLFMIHCGYLLLGYHSKPTLFQINTVVPNEGIAFPDVTICNHLPIVAQRAISYNMSDEVFSYALRFFARRAELEDEDLGRLDSLFADYVNLSQSFDVLQFLQDVGPTCEEMLLGCAFGGHVLKNCCQYSVPVLTDAGLCMRFRNEDKRWVQQLGGAGFGWDFVLDGKYTGHDLLGNVSLPAVFGDLGFRVSLHETGKESSMRSGSFSVPPNFSLQATLHIRNTSLLDKQSWGVCERNWTGPHFLDLEYTQLHCEQNCQLHKTLDACKCMPAFLALNLLGNATHPRCTPLQYSNCSIKEPMYCGCESECDLLELDVDVDYRGLPGFIVKKFDLEPSYAAENVAVVAIFLPTISYERHEQQKQLQMADLLSNIAGSMGLFLGMSTVTLLEIFIFLFKAVWGTVNSTRQRQFMEAAAEEERERQQSFLLLDDDEPEIHEGRRRSTVLSAPFNTHLDRRNSRMLRGGDLYSAARHSMSIATPMLSPLSHHHRSSSRRSVGPVMVRIAETSAAPSGLPPKATPSIPRIRRRSTIAPPTFKRDSSTSVTSSGDQEAYLTVPRSSRRQSRRLSQSLWTDRLL